MSPRLLFVTNRDPCSSIWVYAQALSKAVSHSFQIFFFDGQSVQTLDSLQAREAGYWDGVELGTSSYPRLWLDYKSRLKRLGSEFDLIHICSQRFAFLASDPKKHIITVHDLFPQSLRASNPSLFQQYNSGLGVRVRHRFFWQNMRRLARSGVRVVVDSDAMKGEISSLLDFPRQLVSVVHIPVDSPSERVSKDFWRTRLGIPSEADVVLSVSSDDPRKNLEALYQLLPNLSSRAHLIRVGPTQISKIPQDMRPRVHLLENLSSAEMRAAYRASDVLFFPSYAEGYGLPVIEAMAAGVPVVASRIPSIEEIVEGSAILVPPDDHAGQKDAVTRLFNDSNLRTTLIQQGLERALRFTPAAVAPTILEAYGTVIGSH